MSLSLDFHFHFANMLFAFRNRDFAKYMKELEICKKWLSEDIYSILFNLSKSSAFVRKGEYKK